VPARHGLGDVFGRGEPGRGGEVVGDRGGQLPGEHPEIRRRHVRVPVRVDAEDAAPPPRQFDHRVGVGVVDGVRGLPYVAELGQSLAAEHGGDGGAG